MRAEKDITGKLFTIARIIDSRPKDIRYYEGTFWDLLWVLNLEESFRKALLPDTIVRSVTGKTFKRTNYQRTLEKVFNTQNTQKELG